MVGSDDVALAEHVWNSIWKLWDAFIGPVALVSPRIMTEDSPAAGARRSFIRPQMSLLPQLQPCPNFFGIFMSIVHKDYDQSHK